MLTCKLEMIENKPYLRMVSYYKGVKATDELAKVYDWNGHPYIRRLRQRMALTAEMIEGKTVTYGA